MALETFRFKQFSVQQAVNAGMKVGTDGVLLGAWCRVEATQVRMLDVGTGTGVIALILAQRAPGAVVDALDLDPQCCRQATANVATSAWSRRITVVHSPVQEYACACTTHYDHIVSNPPYFNDSLLPPAAARARARHTACLPHRELMAAVAALLAPEGIFSVILPVEEALQMQQEALLSGLHLRRATQVVSRDGAAPKRLLMEFGALPVPVPESATLTIMDAAGREFTPQYRMMTREFYLKF